MSTVSWSPEFMNRSVAGFGVKVPVVWSSGPGGSCGAPLFVMNAKFAGSSPTVFRQAALLSVTGVVFWSRWRLKIAIAAHHLLASQLTPGGQGAHPGG